MRGARLRLIASMLIFGTIGLVRRFLPLPSGLIACVRGAGGALFLCLLMMLRRRKPDRAAMKANLGRLLLSGALIGINWVFLFEAYNHTTVAVATLCYYLAPVFVLLLSPAVLGERLTLRRGLCAAVALAGLVLVSGVLTEGASGDLLGPVLATGAALLYACVVLTNKKLKPMPAREQTIVQMAAAALVVLPYTLVSEPVSGLRWTPEVLLLLAVAAVVHTGIAYELYFGSVEALPAHTLAMLSYLDPVTAVLLSALVLHEAAGPAVWIGAVLILGGAMLSEGGKDP